IPNGEWFTPRPGQQDAGWTGYSCRLSERNLQASAQMCPAAAPGSGGRLVISALSQAGASAAVASGSSGFSTVDAILVIVVVVVVLVVVGRFSRRLALRPRGLRASGRDA